MPLNTSLAAAVEQPFLRQFFAVKVTLPNSITIRLLDGSGYVVMNGETFDGSDPVFGSLASASSFSEQIASGAPRWSFSLMPPTPAALGTLADPKNQGASVMCWWGIVNEMTGTVIGSPELLWSGRIDTVKTNFDQANLAAEIETVSAFDRLFVAEEGARLNKTFHQSIFPGETGLDYAVEALGEILWGSEGSQPAIG